MGLDFAFGRLDALRQSRHLEHGLLVAAGRHDVRMRLMLNSLDGRALRAYDQTHYSVGHSYLNRYVTRHRRGWPGWRAQECAQRALARRADLREVLRGGEDLALRSGNILLATSDDEDGLLAAHRRFDVGVRLRSKGFNLAACNQTKKDMRSVISTIAQMLSNIKYLIELSIRAFYF